MNQRAPHDAAATAEIDDGARRAWHTLDPADVLAAQDVDSARGLDATDVERRRSRFGPNALAAAEVESRPRAFVRQYADPMQLVLLVAGVISLYPLKELETGLVLVALTLFNAVLGLQQEGKAAAAVAALQKMMVIQARVTREGRLGQVPAEELVPGDIV